MEATTEKHRGDSTHADTEPKRGAPRIRFRSDIEGLRAVAIALVVLDHLGVRGFEGRGFIGVDVFFVISGFLITSLLAAERERSGDARARSGISLRAFYVRRARRILPAALTVIAATLIAAELWMNPIRVIEVQADAFWATFFVANLQLMHQATDYFAAGLAVSPLQNFWSLAVEEQFYLVWPLLLIVVTTAWARLNRSGRIKWHSAALVAIGVVFSASLAWSVVECSADPAPSYFSPFTRAWELALGAIVALLLGSGLSPGRRAAVASGVGGLSLIALGLLVVEPGRPYPGAIALIPTAGAALLIAAGGRPGIDTPTASLLALRPVRMLGRISYSLYLWHWPIIVFAGVIYSQRALDGVIPKVALGLISLGAATISYRLVETPYRHVPITRAERAGSREATRDQWSALRGAALGCFALAVVAVIVLFARPDASSGQRDAGAEAAALANWQAELAKATSVTRVDQSSIDLAAEGKKLGPGSCWDTTKPAESARCTLAGRGTAPGIDWPAGTGRDVVLLGNSFAAQWRETVASVLPRGTRLIPITATGCDPSDATSSRVNADRIECGWAVNEALSRIASIKPGLVVFSTTQGAGPDHTGQLLSRLSIFSPHIAWIGFPPATKRFDRCIAKGGNVEKCSGDGSSKSWNSAFNNAFSEAARAHGAAYANLFPVYCFDGTCPGFVAGQPIRTDGTHLTDFAMSAASPSLAQAIKSALMQRAR